MNNLITNPGDYLYVPPPPAPPVTNLLFGGEDINKIREFIINSLSKTVSDDHKSSEEKNEGINETTIKCLLLAFLSNNEYYIQRWKVTSEFLISTSGRPTYVDLVLEPKPNHILLGKPEQHVLIELKHISLAYLRNSTYAPPTQFNYRNPYWVDLLESWRRTCANTSPSKTSPIWKKSYPGQKDNEGESISDDIIKATTQLDTYLKNYKTKCPPGTICHGLIIMVIAGVPFFYWKDGTPRIQAQSSLSSPPPMTSRVQNVFSTTPRNVGGFVSPASLPPLVGEASFASSLYPTGVSPSITSPFRPFVSVSNAMSGLTLNTNVYPNQSSNNNNIDRNYGVQGVTGGDDDDEDYGDSLYSGNQGSNSSSDD